MERDRRAESAAYYLKHRDRIRARSLAYYAANRTRILERFSRTQRFRKTGMTPEYYDEMLSAQEGACAICGEVQDRRLVGDHDHESGTLRGLLCRNCNVGIGLLRDSPKTLLAAAGYLEHYRALAQK